jgi:hypothetical protein
MIAKIIVSQHGKQAIVDLTVQKVFQTGQKPEDNFKEDELCDLLRPYLEDYLDKHPTKRKKTDAASG